MQKLIRNTLCVAALGMGLWQLASAGAPGDGEEPPPPPPPKLNDCSPGFWKNHTEYWVTQYCGSDDCVADALADLTSRGKGSDELRHDRAADLNAFADTYYTAKICTD